jgi:hypothetical protein
LDEAISIHRDNVYLAKKLGSAHQQVQAASNLLAFLVDVKRAEEGLAEAALFMLFKFVTNSCNVIALISS